MKKQVVYAVFTSTSSGLDYMVKGGFGKDKAAAETWVKEHVGDVNEHEKVDGPVTAKDFLYPNGLFVKPIKF